MVVYKDWGPLAGIIMAAALFGGYFFFEFLHLDPYAFGIPAGCLVGGGLTWVLGRRLNAGERRHDLYDIRMEYWDIIFPCIVLPLWYAYPALGRETKSPH